MGAYNRKDHLFERAKSEGYRSRAAYKLQEIQTKLKLIRKGDAVLDLGAWPGGWLQVAAEYVGSHGRVVGIDLQKIEDLGASNIKTVVGDITDHDLIGSLSTAHGPFNGVISDLSPKLTGIREVDHAATEHLAERTLQIAREFLAPGGYFVIKLFKSPTATAIVKQAKPLFAKSRSYELDATRSTSNEFYFVAQEKKQVSQDAAGQLGPHLA
jgi:23S rRNA (uridine2552-2'-O)-methyltransferase